VVSVINDNPYGLMFSFEMYLKECSIDNALIILDGFNAEGHQDKDMH
jgi:hypothetical protein